jgi:hypothetical protein
MEERDRKEQYPSRITLRWRLWQFATTTESCSCSRCARGAEVRQEHPICAQDRFRVTRSAAGKVDGRIVIGLDVNRRYLRLLAESLNGSIEVIHAIWDLCRLTDGDASQVASRECGGGGCRRELIRSLLVNNSEHAIRDLQAVHKAIEGEPAVDRHDDCAQHLDGPK